MLLHLLSLLSTFTFVASAPLDGNDIIGGRPATNGEWPWQAFIALYNPATGRTKMCGGSLISKRHVVTAAHCTLGIRPWDTRVMLGSVKRNDNVRNNPHVLYLDARRVWIHPEYTGHDPSFQNDISIIELTTNVKFNEFTKPIKIRRNDTELRERFAYITGWGLTSAGSGGSPQLMQTRVPFISTDYCRRRWLQLSHQRIVVEDKQLCAGSYRRGTAPGDSGGPLVVKAPNNQWYLAGLTSFGENSLAGLEDQFRYPGVYLRLSQYCDDINKQTGDLALCV